MLTLKIITERNCAYLRKNKVCVICMGFCGMIPTIPIYQQELDR